MAGLVAERLMGTTAFADISAALDDPGNYQGIFLGGERKPDYLMWDDSNSTAPYYVVECKGSQTNRATSIGQLRSGLEQIPSVQFGRGPRNIISLVIGTFLRQSSTRVFIVDPPNGIDPENYPKEPSKKATERIGEKEWRILDWARFDNRAWIGHELQLLRWVEQHETANSVARSMEISTGERAYPVRNAPLELKETPRGIYQGLTSQFGPGFRGMSISAFRGVRDDLLTPLLEMRHEATRQASSRMVLQPESDLPSNSSFGPNGTCLIVNIP